MAASLALSPYCCSVGVDKLFVNNLNHSGSSSVIASCNHSTLTSISHQSPWFLPLIFLPIKSANSGTRCAHSAASNGFLTLCCILEAIARFIRSSKTKAATFSAHFSGLMLNLSCIFLNPKLCRYSSNCFCPFCFQSFCNRVFKPLRSFLIASAAMALICCCQIS